MPASKTKLKPWFIAVAAFAMLAVTADYLVTREAIDNNPSGDAGRLHHLLVENGSEIPIFGSSRVFNNYIPTEMGLDAFNYGLDAASYEVTDTFLQIELAKHKTTPIIVDMKPDAGRTIGDVGVYIPFVFDPRIRQMLDNAGELEWQYRLLGIRYYGYYDYYLKELVNDRLHLTRTVVRGYSHEKIWGFDRARLDAAIRERLQTTNGYFPVADQDQRLIAHIQEHPERLFFLVFSPVHSSCYVNFQNLDQFNAFKARMSAFSNVVVIDYGQLNYPDKWFKDTNHLLYDGAVDFSRRLGAKIKEVLQKRVEEIKTTPTTI